MTCEFCKEAPGYDFGIDIKHDNVSFMRLCQTCEAKFRIDLKEFVDLWLKHLEPTIWRKA